MANKMENSKITGGNQMKNNKKIFQLILSICVFIYFGRHILTLPDIILGVVTGIMVLCVIFQFLPEDKKQKIKTLKKNI